MDAYPQCRPIALLSNCTVYISNDGADSEDVHSPDNRVSRRFAYDQVVVGKKHRTRLMELTGNYHDKIRAAAKMTLRLAVRLHGSQLRVNVARHPLRITPSL